MSSKNEARDAIFAKRAGAVAAASKNHTHLAAPHGIRGNGSNHTKITRQANPGRTNAPKAK